MLRSVVPFRRWHYAWLSDNGSAGLPMARSTLMHLEQQNSWTFVLDGEVIACVGSMAQWPGRHTLWAYLNDSTGPRMRWITRESLRLLRDVAGRVEFTVRADFLAGQRWAKLLGFEVETPLLRAFGPEGEDHVGYVRFN